LATRAPALTVLPELLVDSSVAVAMMLAGHEGHAASMEARRGWRLGLAGHAWFETYSVLTRMPPGSRLPPDEAHALLVHDFPATRFLDASALDELRGRLARLGISGGAVYDALVAETARVHGLPLLTRDRRAAPTYSKLGVDVRLIGNAPVASEIDRAED
jgi:predicted nucleic acid-binding protein